MSIHRNWPNLVPVLRIWRKKYSSGEKNIQMLTLSVGVIGLVG